MIFSVFWELDRVLVMVVNWDQQSSDTNVKNQNGKLKGISSWGSRPPRTRHKKNGKQLESERERERERDNQIWKYYLIPNL